MDLTQLANLGEFIGGVAVLVTLIYLTVQIRHARHQLRYQGETDIRTRLYDAWAPVYQGRNAEILWKGLNDPSALTEADFFVFDLLMHRHYNVLVETHRNLEAGMASQNWASSVGEEYRSILAAKPGGRAWLREHMDTHEGAAKLLGPIE